MFVRIDENGRVVIPSELRRSLGLYEKNKIGIKCEDGRMVISDKVEALMFERTIDRLGRFTLPASIRRELGLSFGARGKYEIINGLLTLSKSDVHCIYCGSLMDVKEFKSIYICKYCIMEIKNNEIWMGAY